MADFHIYRSKQNPSHFVAVLASDRSANAEGVRKSSNLSLLMTDPRRGQAAARVRPAAAKAAIRDRGFHAFALTVEPRDHFE